MADSNAQKIKLEIVTPSERLVLAECDDVKIPGFKGELEILESHAELLSTLVTGLVKYTSSGESHKVAVKGGFLQVNDNHIRLLADEGQTQASADLSVFKEQLKELEQKLVSADVGIEEREDLFLERDWLQALISL